MPKEWTKDIARRKKAAVPAELRFRTKPQIALKLIRQSMAQGIPPNMAAQAHARSATQTTTPLNPFNGQPPGYNMRPPAGPASSPRPLLPNGGSGSGGAAIEYYPGRPGAQTRAEAIDITKLQR